MNNKFFIKELAKKFRISEENTTKLLNKVVKTIKREKTVTKNLLARVMIHNLRKIRKEEETIYKEKLLKKYKHKHLQKHFEKFMELYRLGWGAKKISNYFKNTLKKEISKSYLDQVLKTLREEEKANQEKKEENGKSEGINISKADKKCDDKNGCKRD